MKSALIVDDNGQGMEKARALLRDHGYSVCDSGPEADDAKRFQFAMDRACIQVFWLLENGRLAYVNEAACRSLGYGYEELTGMTVYNLSPHCTVEEYAVLWQQIRKQGDDRFEAVHQTRDGRTYPVEIQSNFVEFEGCEYCCCFVTDITERKRAEEKLLLHEFCIEKASIGIVMTSMDGRISMANECACRSLGYSRDELCAMNVIDIDPAITVEKIRAILEQLETNGSVTHETVHRRRDGTTFPVEITTNNIEFHGTTYSYSFAKDISGRKQAEEKRKLLETQLHQIQKLDAVGQLAGGIAHDFNNILTAIIGFAEVMDMRMEQGAPLRHHVRQILAAAERAADLTQGLLAFSRKQVLHVRCLDLREIIDGLKKMLCRLIPEDIDFRVKTAATEMTVMADRGQIEQVLMNLVTNARDAMPGGGVLTIETGTGVIDEEFVRTNGFGVMGNYALISVTDNGCGMNAETREKVFEPFFTTKRLGKGTGLGLSIIYGIVKQHDGFITVDSSPGQGATFRVYLPLAGREKEETREHRQTPLPKRGNETVLLVEDDEVVRELNRVVLEYAGYTVIETIDGREALERFREQSHRMDILVSDIIMPNLDGKALYDEIMKIRPDMKVLFISGYAEDALDARGLFESEHNFMPKPVKPSELLKRVREILDHP